ncbi:MAG: hypothetical protein A2270_11825 [Elusimicrobia bacterium RIFOXYA12_FULL_51_18]|nr:MAG: hypothetical protein A2270_11825 [Elusimicrobia bacterium RIFOXYA12_FULL_51_18]OGS28851.1 MAG: hypothetical protein A2218_09285 [Elusimicrobia bacterium RIFOXYA2_FULL_53_38]
MFLGNGEQILMINNKTGIFIVLLFCMFAGAAKGERESSGFFRFVVMSDLNPGCGETSVTGDFKKTNDVVINKIKPSFILIAGDMIGVMKGDNCLPPSAYPKMWKSFFAEIERYYEAGIPVYISAGNHDAGYKDALGIYRAEWSDYQHKPLNTIGDFPLYYSFNIKNNHFISMPVYKLPVENEALVWLEQDLNQARKQYENVFVFQHVPVKGAGCKGEPGIGRTYAEMLKGKVGAVFTGHEHCYRDMDAFGVRQITGGPAGDPSPRGVNKDMNFLVVDVKGKNDFTVYPAVKKSGYLKTFEGKDIPIY